MVNFSLDNIMQHFSSLKGLSGDTPITDVLKDDFIQEHTQFKTVTDFLEKSGFNISDISSLKHIPKEELNAFIKEHSDFESGKAFIKALSENVLNKK